jgi:hypothetical protein
MIRQLLIIFLLSATLPVYASGVGGMFGQGRTQFSLVGGNGYAFDNNYFVLGVSVSYNVLDGLGVGLSLEKWSGGNPSMTKFAPFVQYVFYQPSSSIHPYVGAFYRHTVINGLPDINSVGERAGINITAGPNAYASFGFVQEVYLDCQESIYQTCRETYPDLGITFGF